MLLWLISQGVYIYEIENCIKRIVAPGKEVFVALFNID